MIGTAEQARQLAEKMKLRAFDAPTLKDARAMIEHGKRLDKLARDLEKAKQEGLIE